MNIIMRLSVILLLVWVGSPAWAEQIMLKNGDVVQGKILDQSNGQYKVDVHGVQITYFADEVYSIDGQPVGTPAAAPAVAPAAVKTAPEASPAAADLTAPIPTSPGAPAANLPFRPAGGYETATPNLEAVTASTTSPATNIMDKKQLIRQFLNVYGTRDTMQQNFDYMFSHMSPQDAQTYKRVFNVDAILERLIPLYDKEFTADELKNYITFYTSPAGQKLLQTIPIIMQESIKVSAEYLKEKMPEKFPKSPRVK